MAFFGNQSTAHKACLIPQTKQLDFKVLLLLKESFKLYKGIIQTISRLPCNIYINNQKLRVIVINKTKPNIIDHKQ